MKRMIFVAALLLTATACGPAETPMEMPHEEHEDIDAEGCEHMKEGPAKAVTATADVMSAPDATAEHTRVDLTLADDGASMYVGWVAYDAAEGGDHVIFLPSDVPFVLETDAGTAVMIEDQGVAVAECTEVALKHVFELDAGSSYRLKFGPTDVDMVSFVLEHDGGHMHEEGHMH